MSFAVHASDPAAVSVAWKWFAVLIGLVVLAVIALIAAIPTKGKLWQLAEGADGRASTSKFQWLLWIVAVAFAYTVLWVLRAKQGDYTAITQVPVNLLTLLGFSTGTAAAAKGITAGYVQSSKLAKPVMEKNAKGGLIQDDSGVPDLGKLQMIAFTLIAVGVFFWTLIHQIASTPVITGLPNVDSSLLVLMGISQGGYLGKKLVTFNSPVLYTPSPVTVTAGTPVTVTGANLGTPSANSGPPLGAALTVDGSPVGTTNWSSSSISFTAPADAGPVQVAVTVGGQQSNTVTLTVEPPAKSSPNGSTDTQAVTAGTSG
jgi:hypothetical protein